MARHLAAAWVYDAEEHKRANTRGWNYWDLYIGEICAQMGLTVDMTTPVALAQLLGLGRYSCLMMGSLKEGTLTDETKEELWTWLKHGGLLIGFNTGGLDDLFGVGTDESGKELVDADPFAQTAFMRLSDHPFCQGIRPDLHPDKPLLVYGETRMVQPTSSQVVADLVDLDGARSMGAAVTVRRVGEGWAVYFAFPLPQTIWVLHQGRPIDRDWDGDGYYRTGDSFVIGDNEIEVPYADQLVWLLENVIGLLPQPLIYTMPPVKDKVPTALFYWAGDDEFAAGDQVKASNYMHSLGLPYHINIMYRNGAFSISPEEGRIINENGHDFSLHYNFVPASGFHSGLEFDGEDVRMQADAFHAHFGVRPYANVNHWLRWVGYAEPARWMAEVGGKGDGSFVHARMPPLDPCDIFGFPFGTSFPFRFYEDWRRGNERLEFVEKPLTGYEMGYNGDDNDFTQLHRLIDLTQRQHLMTSMFYHSNRIANIPTCRAAIGEVLRYLEERGIAAKHMSLNGLVRWWFDRLASSVGAVTVSDEALSMHITATSPEGLVVRVPVGGRRVTTVICDGSAVASEVWQERGWNWLIMPLPAGEHHVEIRWV